MLIDRSDVEKAYETFQPRLPNCLRPSMTAWNMHKLYISLYAISALPIMVLS